MPKLRVGVIFGGKSAEHEVSLQSAKNVMDAMDRNKYEVVPIGIDKQGRWFLSSEAEFLLNENNPKLIKLNKDHSRSLAIFPGEQEKQLIVSEETGSGQSLDVVFPVLHGPLGEDGTVQGLLKILDIPFVGPGVLGSAIGMDKDVMKRLLRDAGVPVAKYVCLNAQEDFDFNSLVSELGLPLFVKPANMGSSVGVNKASNVQELGEAIQVAFDYDRKVLVESMVVGSEIECSVLGNETPEASLPGRVIPHHEFYSYEAKYIDEKGAGLEVPAKLPQEVVEKVQATAIKTFKVLELEGMARVDMFLTESSEVVVNEVNTIPGFTKISMYPKLWEASGVSYSELIDKLVQLAIERHQKEKRLKTSYS